VPWIFRPLTAMDSASAGFAGGKEILFSVLMLTLRVIDYG